MPMLRNMKLGFRLNLILALLFILAIVSCGSLLSYTLEQKVEREIANKASLAIETMSAVRSYTSDRIQPELSDRLILEEQFLPETVPAYAAREVFERLKKDSKYRDFSYKEATINPTNPQDKADRFESILVEKFRTDDNLKQLSGFRVGENSNLFYIARPMSVNSVSCLQCHSLPESAPPSLINTYGDRNGFGWRLNEIVATQIIYVPASTITTALEQLRFSTIAIVVLCLGATMIIINFFLRNHIIKPLEGMASLSNKISLGATELEFTHFSNNELGILAKALNRMKCSFQMAEKMIEENEKQLRSDRSLVRPKGKIEQ